MGKELLTEYDLYSVQDEVYDRSWNDRDKFWSMNALIGEIGEVSNFLKKEVWFEKKEAYKKRVTDEILAGERKAFEERILDELGDVFFYFTQLCAACGWDLNQVWKDQLKKLQRQDDEIGEKFKK